MHDSIRDLSFLVIGLGTTGVALSRFLLRRGAYVTGLENDPQKAKIPAFEKLSESDKNRFVLSDGSDLSEEKILSFAKVLVSPGVSLDHPIVKIALDLGLSVSGEIEFAAGFASGKIIAITGTNGKSTTTELVAAMLQNQGFSVAVGGNLGTPWVELIEEKPNPDWTVLELSSFQLETTVLFHPQIAVFLNLTDDHFDRHPTLQAYGQAKAKIFQNQNENDFLIHHADDVQVLRHIQSAKSRRVPFSSVQIVNGVFWKTKETIESHAPIAAFSHASAQNLVQSPRTYLLKQATLKGLHNIENMMAAIAAAEIAGASPEVIQQTLETFKPLPHRLEFVRTHQGVRYFDDSKGTNVGAVALSLASFEEPVILILGGKDKGGDYGILAALIRHKVKALILLGEAKEKIRARLGRSAKCYEVASIEEAVKTASGLAEEGDVVLLSPACSSFDMFRDYKHRGEEFQKWVNQL